MILVYVSARRLVNAVADATRTMGRGGGVAIMYRQHLKCSTLPMEAWPSLEVISVPLIATSGPFVIINIYRPGSSLIFEELTNVVEMLVVYSCPVMVGGDVNLRAQEDNDTDTRRFINILSSFNMIHHVHSLWRSDDMITIFSCVRLVLLLIFYCLLSF